MPGHPRPQRVLDGQQEARQQDEVRDDRAEHGVAGEQQQEGADEPADAGDDEPGAQRLAGGVDLAAQGPRPADVAGAQGDGVGGVGVHRRHPDRREHREADQRAAAGQRVDGSGADRRGSRGEVGERGDVGHGPRLCPIRPVGAIPISGRARGGGARSPLRVPAGGTARPICELRRGCLLAERTARGGRLEPVLCRSALVPEDTCGDLETRIRVAALTPVAIRRTAGPSCPRRHQAARRRAPAGRPTAPPNTVCVGSRADRCDRPPPPARQVVARDERAADRGAGHVCGTRRGVSPPPDRAGSWR